jgi:glutamate racemase
MHSARDKFSVGVIAGTSVDTSMGVSCLKNAGISAIGAEIRNDPLKNTNTQVLSPDHMEKAVELRIKRLTEDHGISAVLLYCNSIATAVNLPRLRASSPVPVVTPLETYIDIAKQHNSVGILSANCQALSGIEKTMLAVNEHLQITGIASLQFVLAIEKEYPPERIIRDFGIIELLSFFKKSNIEVLILGCTHFPYLKEEMKKNTDINIFDPGEAMISHIKSCIS